LRSGRRIARQSLIPALEAALSSIDVAIVRRGSTSAVVPLRTARSQTSGVRGGSDVDAAAGYAVEVVALRYGSAREIAKVLGSFARKDNVQVDTERDRFIITGTNPERAAIKRTIASLDVDWLQGMAFALYPLDTVDPETLV